VIDYQALILILFFSSSSSVFILLTIANCNQQTKNPTKKGKKICIFSLTKLEEK